MFNLEAKNNFVSIEQLELHVAFIFSTNIQVYVKDDTYLGFEQDPSAWTLVHEETLASTNGRRQGTPLSPFTEAVIIAPGKTVAFYVTISSGGLLLYTDGSQEGQLFSEDQNLKFYEGKGVEYPFGSTFARRVWNGIIHYTVERGGSRTPSSSPSDMPSESMQPSSSPSESMQPSLSPSESMQPSSSPSESMRPSSSPSDSMRPSSLPTTGLIDGNGDDNGDDSCAKKQKTKSPGKTKADSPGKTKSPGETKFPRKTTSPGKTKSPGILCPSYSGNGKRELLREGEKLF